MSASPWTSPDSDPGRIIVDRRLRKLHDDFLDAVRGLHEGVSVEHSRLETRVLFRGSLLCRVAAYPELFHVRIGEKNSWEIRVRDRAGCAETLDRVLARFLEIYASGTAVSSPPDSVNFW